MSYRRVILSSRFLLVVHCLYVNKVFDINCALLDFFCVITHHFCMVVWKLFCIYSTRKYTKPTLIQNVCAILILYHNQCHICMDDFATCIHHLGDLDSKFWNLWWSFHFLFFVLIQIVGISAKLDLWKNILFMSIFYLEEGILLVINNLTLFTKEKETHYLFPQCFSLLSVQLSMQLQDT